MLPHQANRLQEEGRVGVKTDGDPIQQGDHPDLGIGNKSRCKCNLAESKFIKLSRFNQG